ncbi:MAG: hypothetical protein FJ108_08170 [Deltaproteobacteria bacterium]|nr:hypothetical protein [Deltaproteobacteria bacterium]
MKFGARPWWMNGLFAFCLFMSFVYMPFDFFWKPVADDQEVWFGVLLTGWAAKATEPLHWAIYAAGSWGFWKMRPWMHPWAALYTLQIAIGMLVWASLDPRAEGQRLLFGVPPFLAFAALAWLIFRARAHFGARAG